MVIGLALTPVGSIPACAGEPSSAWGRYGERRAHEGAGSIPACAGEPTNAANTTGLHRVYPRVCGGTASTRTYIGISTGLSPRVRGNPPPRSAFPICRRSIPACAGEPNPRPLGRLPQVVYPRVCGGTYRRWRSLRRGLGLSPRVRGNPRLLHQHPRQTRSIPACAGEPVLVLKRRLAYPVYPRVCGGTIAVLSRAPPFWGLSPRVRGNLD